MWFIHVISFLFSASVALSMFEVGGLAGSILSGYVTDRMVEKVMNNTKHSMQYSGTTINQPPLGPNVVTTLKIEVVT